VQLELQLHQNNNLFFRFENSLRKSDALIFRRSVYGVLGILGRIPRHSGRVSWITAISKWVSWISVHFRDFRSDFKVSSPDFMDFTSNFKEITDFTPDLKYRSDFKDYRHFRECNDF